MNQKQKAHEIAKIAALKAYKTELRKLGQIAELGRDIDLHLPGAPHGNTDKSHGGEVKYAPFADLNKGFKEEVPESFKENYNKSPAVPSAAEAGAAAGQAANQAGQMASEKAHSDAEAMNLPYVIVDGMKYEKALPGDPMSGMGGEQLDSSFNPVPYKEAKMNPKMLRIASVYQNILKKSN